MGKVLTQGSFDVFHEGHVNFLRRCARFGDVHVAVIDDKSYEICRGYPPDDSLPKRMINVEESGFVKSVFPTQPKLMIDDIKRLAPDVVAIGSDWVTKNIYKRWGVRSEDIDDKLIYIPYTKNVSSTKIKERIKNASKS